MESRKKEKFYELYGRPTIEYDASCGKGLDEGLLILDEMERASSIELSWSALIIMAPIMCCAISCLTGCYVVIIDKDRELRNGCMMTFIRTLFLFGLGAVNLFLCITVFSQVAAKQHSSRAWYEFGDCLDEYTAIGEDEVSGIETIYVWAMITLILGLLIFLIQTVFTVFQWVLCCTWL